MWASGSVRLLGGPSFAKMTSTYELAGTCAVPLSCVYGDGIKRATTEISVDSYEDEKEDAQRTMPRLADLRTPEASRTRLPEPETAKPDAKPEPPALEDAPGSTPVTLRNDASPKPKPAEERLPESPGPSLSSASTPAPASKNKRSKSPSYWRPRM